MSLPTPSSSPSTNVSATSREDCPDSHVCPAGSQKPTNCPGPFYVADMESEECVYSYQNIGIMLSIFALLVIVSMFICHKANKESETSSPPPPGAENRRAFRSGPRQIYDPAKANFKEDDVYFGGNFTIISEST